MIAKILVPDEIVNEIQALDVETSARRDLIAFMITNNMNVDTEQFNKYQMEYNKYFKLFDIAKTNFENDFVKAQYPTAENWELLYASREVVITYA